jgi:trehalose/maltose hydrolase-like predicted phosphorylase
VDFAPWVVGIEPQERSAVVDPRLPPQLAAVRYPLLVGQCWLDVDLADGRLMLSNLAGNVGEVKVTCEAERSC